MRNNEQIDSQILNEINHDVLLRRMLREQNYGSTDVENPIM